MMATLSERKRNFEAYFFEYQRARDRNLGCAFGKHSYRLVWGRDERRLRVCLRCGVWNVVSLRHSIQVAKPTRGELMWFIRNGIRN